MVSLMIVLELMNKMNKGNLPLHIAIIPDGNRRWAKKKGLAPWRGHIAGAKIGVEQSKVALNFGIYCLSFWGGSWNNLTNRSNVEINALLKLYVSYFRKCIKNKEIHENNVKVNVIGRWKELLSKSGIETAEELMRVTKNYDKRLLNFFIGYNGTDEMVAAVKGIVKEARVNKNLKVTPELLEKHLWTHDLPPVDLLIRTGINNDPHNSVGFMMWHTSNSQYYFTNTMYPDFGKKEFTKAIKEYQKRERRLGK